MDIGKTIKYYRKLNCLTQSKVAELSGINEKYLGRIERNESVPTIDKVEQLCVAFDISPADLLMVKPERLDTHFRDVSNTAYSENGILETMYYCNCCGCTFREDYGDEKDIFCPECGCIYDENVDYIEKFLV